MSHFSDSQSTLYHMRLSCNDVLKSKWRNNDASGIQLEVIERRYRLDKTCHQVSRKKAASEGAQFEEIASKIGGPFPKNRSYNHFLLVIIASSDRHPKPRIPIMCLRLHVTTR